ncbi:hypothetical protein ENSA5_41250 [Enhygromyxa salina]|uniref:Tetratricopeptide repeat protein n=1 Tax=Enhygromyxa salina TaxID=215803 RepID=A0A2S9XN65_9BACT|nr:hypothetical protein [Enhygromyxa salina]PRP94170.1 hypothetical protein ENSA5_41250 [Enhygromyxa salina]
MPCLVSGGCQSDDKPGPKKLDRVSPFDRGVKPRPAPDPNDPLRNPAYETPQGRDGEQIPDAEIDAVLAEAAAFAETGNLAQQRAVLRKCANKTPASARCDGEMGLSMIKAKNRRAAALYYLVEAAGVDDSKADAGLYARVGEQLRQHGKLAEAAAALELAIAREPSAEHLFALGQILSLQPEHLAAGADRMAEARALDDRIEWLHDEAVIRGQLPIREQAETSLALFKQYIERAKDQPAAKLPTPPDSLEDRMAELEYLVKRYPTQAEWDKQQAEASAAKPEGGSPPAKPAPETPAPEQTEPS